MAKKPAPSATKASTPYTPSSRPTTQTSVSSTPTAASKTSAALPPRSSFSEIVVHVWNRYLNDTPARTLLLDVFMAFLVLVGGVQFVYCVIAGNYPFNAFLSGFSAAVGQFVLTASLRMQTSERSPPTASGAAKKGASKTVDGVTGEIVEEGSGISSERAFADFILGSLILHGFCVNFIN